MGEKARLREELDITEAELRAQIQENKRLHQLLAGSGINVADADARVQASMGPTAMTRPEPPRIYNNPPPPGDAVDFYDGGGRAPMVPDAPDVADARRAITQLRDPDLPPPGPEETLEDIVRANNAERAALQHNQRLANALLSRLAQAVKADNWSYERDPDGSMLLERVQRYETLTLNLRNRLKELVALPEDNAEATAKADEIRRLITMLVAPKDLATFLVSRKVDKVTPPMFANAEAAATATDIPTVTRGDLIMLRDAVAVYAADAEKKIHPWVMTTLKSEEATNVFLELVNVVLLPALARMKIRP